MDNRLNAIYNLIYYSEKSLNLCLEDRVYALNRLCALYKIVPDEQEFTALSLTDALNVLTEDAVKQKIVSEEMKYCFETELMGYITPSAGLVVKTFNEISAIKGSAEAANYLYELSINSGYIRMADVKKNICWRANGKKGEIGLTINLSKPEKDMKQILKEKNFSGKKYPKCMLCLENLGYSGSEIYPARETLRVIPINLAGEKWHFQYSPYVYYDKHCIVFRDEHVPMFITEKTVRRLIEFVDVFPDFFLGSNAAIPIVGGSILSHDHYQGGSKVLPFFAAKVKKTVCKKDGIEISVIDWYNSVVSVSGKDSEKVIKESYKIIELWRKYSDEEAEILSETFGETHNAVTPIAHKENGIFYVDLILRNNRTDEKRPYGIFHPTENYHNIKKEGIGLIEAMGLFILPARLKTELSVLEDELIKSSPDTEKIRCNEKLSKHADMFNEILLKTGGNLSREQAHQAIQNKVNEVGFNILECTAVFKNNDKGEKQFDRFLEHIR